LLEFAHLGVIVSNCKQSSEFYCQVLGCTFESSWQTPDIKAIELRSGNLIIELLQYLSPQDSIRSQGIYDHLAFRTASIENSMQALNKLGVAFKTATPRQLTNGKKIIFFSGPDGERFELIEEP